jgi:hypothetical protein
MLGNRRVHVTRFGVFGAAVVAASGAALVTAPGIAAASSPAAQRPVASQTTSAPAARGACPRSDLCFWVDINYGRARGRVAGNNPDWRRFRQPQCRGGNWNDCASSFVNNGTRDAVVLYQDIDYRGGRLCLPRGAAIANATQRRFNNGVNLNDAVSSNRWVRHC